MRYTCGQCGETDYFSPAAMTQPQITCKHCGHTTVNPPETIEKISQMIRQTDWAAGFASLLMDLEEALHITYEDEEIPELFVTPRQLAAVTRKKMNNVATEEEIMAMIAAIGKIPIADPDMPLEVN
jgi:ribosomal protein S27E